MPRSEQVETGHQPGKEKSPCQPPGHQRAEPILSQKAHHSNEKLAERRMPLHCTPAFLDGFSGERIRANSAEPLKIKLVPRGEVKRLIPSQPRPGDRYQNEHKSGIKQGYYRSQPPPCQWELLPAIRPRRGYFR